MGTEQIILGHPQVLIKWVAILLPRKFSFPIIGHKTSKVPLFENWDSGQSPVITCCEG
jgi:hypothetical protein